MDPRSLGLALLACFYVIASCISFRLSFPYYRDYYLLYDVEWLYYAIAAVTFFSLIAPIFAFSQFSFGYFCGFYFFSIIVGYLWLNSYSKLQYDHALAGASAVASCVAFLLPALLVTSPINRLLVISELAFNRLLLLIVAFCAIVAVSAAIYNFRWVGLGDIYRYRDQVEFPTILNYAIATTTSTLIPFAFACFIERKQPWMAVLVSLISVALYPSTLTKVAFFVPAWLAFIALLSKISGVRPTVILSLLLPLLIGEVLVVAFGERRYFALVNWRMIMLPSQALDVYNEYFAHHSLTHFCQMWLLKPIIPCELNKPLAIEMQNHYGLGNFNASLFATEGIASVGPWLAPLSAFVCGLVVALGNRVSAGLPARFVLISSAVMLQIMMNVPFSIVFLTHGLCILFILWYVTPRSIFELKS
jgi:hypothetical protein